MKRVKENSEFLKATTTAHAEQCKALLQSARNTQLDSICEILLNIVRGVIPIKDEVFKKAKRVKNVLRQLVLKCGNKKLRKELMVKYFGILQKLLSAALPVIGIIVTGANLFQTVLYRLLMFCFLLSLKQNENGTLGRNRFDT